MNTYENEDIVDSEVCQVKCQVNVIHQEQVSQARRSMPEAVLVTEAAELFNMLGDNSRLRILLALHTTELCVCDLAAILDTSSSAVSHQLRLLRAKGLVRFRKEGKIVYYSLTDSPVRVLLEETFKSLNNY